MIMNKKFKVLFQMDQIEKLNLKTDTTISLIKEALKQNLEVYISDPDDLTLLKEYVVIKCKRIAFQKSEVTFGKKNLSVVFLQQSGCSCFVLV